LCKALFKHSAVPGGDRPACGCRTPPGRSTAAMHHSDSGVFEAAAYEPLAGTSSTEDERADEGRGWWKPAQTSFGTPIAQARLKAHGAAHAPAGGTGARRQV